MHDGTAADYALDQLPPLETLSHATWRHWKTIPWGRVVVDAILIAMLMLASASFLTVR
jgi:hypothetical protein